VYVRECVCVRVCVCVCMRVFCYKYAVSLCLNHTVDWETVEGYEEEDTLPQSHC
jgi:hypothetical protein